MSSAAALADDRAAGDRAADERLFTELAPAVLGVLRRRFGPGVEVRSHRFVHHDGHPMVAVVGVEGAPIESAVVKVAVREPGRPFDTGDTGAWSPYGQLVNEWCALEFFGRRGGGQLPVPKFYGGDLDAGLIVMADLGQGDSLAEVLLRAGGAAAAEAALAGYVDAFVALHDASFGQVEEFRQMRRGYGAEADVFGGLTEQLTKVFASARSLGVAEAAGVAEQVQELVRHAAGPPQWQVVGLRDVCPDNNRVLADGRVVLFDGQFAGVQHALVDVAYLHATMPTCWCVRRLPEGLADRLVRRYVDGLRAVGRVVDDAEFDRALRLCRAYLALWRMGGALTRVGPDDDERDPVRWDHYGFDMVTMRQQVLLRAGQVVAALGPVSGFGELRAWAGAVGSAGRAAWPSTRPLPLYPAWAPPA